MSVSSHHCNVLSIANYGILIKGASGAGKSSLTLGLLERASTSELEAQLVSDDQALLEVAGYELIATTPKTIAGKLELRGHGILDVPHKRTTKISLIVQMQEDHMIERMPEQKTTEIYGIQLPKIEVPIRHEQAAVRIIFAWLTQNILSRKNENIRTISNMGKLGKI